MNSVCNISKDEYIKGWIYQRMNISMDEYIKEWIYQRMNISMDEYIKEWIYQGMIISKDEWTVCVSLLFNFNALIKGNGYVRFTTGLRQLWYGWMRYRSLFSW